MNEHLQWVEKAAMENLRARIQTADTLAKEAQTTLTVTLAGCGAALGYALKDGVVAGAVSWSMLAVCAYLMGVAAMITLRCLKIGEIPPLYNEPRNLLFSGHEEHDFEAKVKGEVSHNVQIRIDQATGRNERVANWIDRTRLMLVFSPVVWALAYCLALVFACRVAG